MKQNYRHIDRNLLLGIWLLIKSSQAGKSVIRLENKFLRKWLDQTRISPEKINAFACDIKHIYPVSKYLTDWHHLKVLDLCAHELPQAYHNEIYSVKDVPTEEQMETDLGVQWKCIMVRDYDPRTDSSPYV